MKKHHVLAALLVTVALSLLFVPKFESVRAACQNQVCHWDGECWQCWAAGGFACSIPQGSCSRTCTKTTCDDDGGPGGILPLVSEGAGHETCGGAVLQRELNEAIGETSPPAERSDPAQAQDTEPAPTEPADIAIVPQRGAPARLVQTTHTATDLLAGGRLRNGSSRIFAYRLGWVVEHKSGKLSRVLGDWVSISSGLPPQADTEIPSQHVPFSLIRDGAVRVDFFVAGVVYRDGSKWETDLETIGDSRVKIQAPPNE